MSRLSLGYDIGRFTGACAATGQALQPGTPCITALCEAPDPTPTHSASGGAGQPANQPGSGPAGQAVAQTGFVRRDYSIEAWQTGHRPPGLFSFWRTVAPSPDAPRRLLVDDQSLLDIFMRLEQDQRPERQAFRFVLALILLRRRLLRSVGRDQIQVADTARDDAASTGEGAATRRADTTRDVWLLQPRGAVEGAPPLRVIDPRLTELDLAAMAEQLGEVVETGGA